MAVIRLILYQLILHVRVILFDSDLVESASQYPQNMLFLAYFSCQYMVKGTSIIYSHNGWIGC